MKKILIFCLFCAISLVATAQQNSLDNADSLVKKINEYGDMIHLSGLFLHTDKDVYRFNETIYFTGFLLSEKPGGTDVLVVSLVNINDKHVEIEKKFIISNNISSGSILIPDTIGAGKYILLAYSNRINNALAIDTFKKQLTIQTNSASRLSVKLNTVDDTVINSVLNRHAVLHVDITDREKASDISKLKYLATFNGKILHRFEKVDRYGNNSFFIPEQEIPEKGGLLSVNAMYSGEREQAALIIAKSAPYKKVKFYPEGGHMVEGIISKVGWEVTDDSGKPLDIDGLLFEDNKLIDTIRTSYSGIGHFQLSPKKGSKYYVKLLNSTTKDGFYDVPISVVDGLSISVGNAVAGDILRLTLLSKVVCSGTAIIHDFHQVYAIIPYKVNNLREKIQIDLQGVPKGLAAITVLDAKGEPSAERIFFSHYNDQPAININTDKNVYGKRQNVIMNMDIPGLEPGDSAKVSVACVQETRLRPNSPGNIVDFYYLKRLLENFPYQENINVSGEPKRQYLEDILLIKGWRSYKWRDIKNFKQNKIQASAPINFGGYVTDIETGRRLKNASLTLMNDSAMTIIKTGLTGEFTLNPQDLLSSGNKEFRLFANGYNRLYTSIHYVEPYSSITSQIINHLPLNELLPFTRDYSKPQTSIFESTINLKEIVIKGSKGEDFINFMSKSTIANACGDYVCMYGMLNCPFPRHWVTRSIPVKGHGYLKHVVVNGEIVRNESVAYLGCVLEDNAKNHSILVSGIEDKEFYEFAPVNNSDAAPQYYSTIYWNGRVVYTKTGQVLKFETGDITGNFRIIVQGVTNKKVIYGERTIEVSK